MFRPCNVSLCSSIKEKAGVCIKVDDYLELIADYADSEKITKELLLQGIESIDWDVYDLIFIDDTGTNGDFLMLTKYETIRVGSILLADYGLTLDDIIGYEVEDEFFRTLYFGLVIYGVKNKESDYEETISLVRQAIEQRDE